MPKIKLRYGQIYLCKCPTWCKIGIHIATWNGHRFEIPEQEHTNFDQHVTAFISLTDDFKTSYTKTGYTNYESKTLT